MLPDTTQLVSELIDCLEAATHEGQRIATGLESRGLFSAAKNIAARAAQIVGAIGDQITTKVDELIDKAFGPAGGAGLDQGQALADVKEQVDEWAKEYAETVATTEVHSAVEDAALNEYKANPEYNAVWWWCEPDACERCQENADASPIRWDIDFPSGDTVPPAHPNCRCTTSPTWVDDDD